MISPVLLGAGATVHLLQTGDDVEDTIHIAALAVAEAQSRDRSIDQVDRVK